MRKNIYLILFLTIVLPRCVFGADGPGYHLRQYTDENGLPQNSIQDLAFGNYGFVWIASQGGLARFDGQQIRVFTKKELHVNSDRYVAVGFETQLGTDVLTAITEHRQLVMIDGGTAFGDRHAKATQMASLRRIKSELETNHIGFDTVRGPGNYLQYKLAIAGRERYYVYTDQKVAFFEHGKMAGAIAFAGTPYFKPLPSVARIRKQVVEKTKQLICTDNFMIISGKLFYHMGSEGTGFLKLSPNGSARLNMTGAIEHNPAFANKKDHIRVITNRFKGQAFAYLNKNIYQVLFNDQSGRLETKLLIENLDIDEKLIHRMLYDEGNGTLFLGSVSQGLFVARPNQFQVVGVGKGNPFNSYFYAQAPFTDSSVLTPEGLIIRRSDIRPAGSGFFKAPEDVYSFSMARDDEGNFWGIEPHRFSNSAVAGGMRGRRVICSRKGFIRDLTEVCGSVF